MKNTLVYIILFATIISCNKQDKWLEIKRNKSDVIPKTLKDFQGILDNGEVLMNFAYNTLGTLGADNHYILDNDLNTLSAFERYCYTWNKVIYEGNDTRAYLSDYMVVSRANIVLEGLSTLQTLPSEQEEYNNIKGQALFFRSIAFYNLSQTYAKQYDSATAVSDLGVVLKLNSNINDLKKRSSVKQTYEQIVTDLVTASTLLSSNQIYKLRPSKEAAYSLLAKTYLLMGDYANSKKYCDSALIIKNLLLDFNSNLVSLDNYYRFPNFSTGNPEIIFFSTAVAYNAASPFSTLSYVDTVLYNMYETNDLRKTFFYVDNGNNRISFRGCYTGDFMNFTGLATNEIYLARAECNSRLGNLSEALSDLNFLLKNRYVVDTYIEFQSSDPDIVLSKILDERRKELPFTAQIRWEDLRRLNRDERFARTIKRIVNGTEISLPPNDNRYVYPIPPIEVELAGTQQNER